MEKILQKNLSNNQINVDYGRLTAITSNKSNSDDITITTLNSLEEASRDCRCLRKTVQPL